MHAKEQTIWKICIHYSWIAGVLITGSLASGSDQQLYQRQSERFDVRLNSSHEYH